PVMEYLISKGMTAQAAAGIYGNLYAESSCRPEARNDANKEVGIAQETGGGYDRYLAYAKEHGKAWDDLYCQLDYILDNCQTNRFKWQAKVDGDKTQQYGSVTRMRYYGYTVSLISWEKFCRTTDVSQAASSFLAIYEDCLYEWTAEAYGRPSLESWIQEQVSNRSMYAIKAYDEYKEYKSMKDYIQSDPSWGSHPYAGENMAVAGCGPTSCADVVSLITNQIPPDVADYITRIGGASNGYGTYWEGITAACQHYGMETKQLNSSSLYGTVDSAAEKEFLSKMKTGDYVGILLMGNGFFCKGGHYIAVEYVLDDNTIKVLDVAYSPRSVKVNWYATAPAGASGNAVGLNVPYFRGRVKVFYLIRKEKPEVKPVVKTDPTTYVTTFRQIKYGDKNMPEIYIWKEFMIAEGLYSGKLDFTFDAELDKATRTWQKSHTDWETKKPLAVDGVVGPCSWRRAMHMKGSQNGSKITFILREKFPGEHGTTCRFTQKVERARGMYKAAIDDDNGNANQAGNVAYKTARGFKERSGKITVEMLRDMCGGC
ncbi:MAG: phage tail tip lysozyme, partial [Lachnospiraceae bacterium]|nr:phage tail tip lysozyme [Lachnospiraceae bacterium]